MKPLEHPLIRLWNQHLLSTCYVLSSLPGREMHTEPDLSPQRTPQSHRWGIQVSWGKGHKICVHRQHSEMGVLHWYFLRHNFPVGGTTAGSLYQMAMASVWRQLCKENNLPAAHHAPSPNLTAAQGPSARRLPWWRPCLGFTGSNWQLFPRRQFAVLLSKQMKKIPMLANESVFLPLPGAPGRKN